MPLAHFTLNGFVMGSGIEGKKIFKFIQKQPPGSIRHVKCGFRRVLIPGVLFRLIAFDPLKNYFL